MISFVERKEIISFIKNRYPIESLIFDSTRGSEPFKIKKNSVFEVYEWEYSEEFKPEHDKDFYVDFCIKNPGRYSPIYYICCLPKKWILKKYQKNENSTSNLPNC